MAFASVSDRPRADPFAVNHGVTQTAPRRRVRPHCQVEQLLPVALGFAQRGLGRDEAEICSVVFDVAHPAVTVAVKEQFADTLHPLDRAKVDFASEQPRPAEEGRPLRDCCEKTPLRPDASITTGAENRSTVSPSALPSIKIAPFSRINRGDA